MKTLRIIAAGALVALMVYAVIGCSGGTASVSMRSGKVYYHQNKDYPKAEELFKKAIIEDPNNWEAQYYLALSLVKQEKFEEAGPAFDAAYALAPAEKKEEVRQNQRAEFAVHFNAGNSARDSNSLREAVAEYEKAVGVYPHDVSGYVNLSQIYNKLGEVDKALAVMKHAVAVDSMSAIAWYNLGVVYLDADQKDLAAEAFDKVVNLGPKDPELAFTAVYNLANLYFDTKQYEKALQNYNKAAELRGSYAPVQYQIGVTYLLLEKYAEAEGALQKCVSLTQDDTTEGGRALYQDAMYNLGISYIQVQNFDKAIATFTTLLARQETAEIHEALGRAYSRKGDSGKALEELQKAEAFRNK